MQLRLEKGSLCIDVGFWQGILAARRYVNVPLTYVEGATTETPRLEWRELKAPGSFIPGLVKAGTYRWWGRKKEFWFATPGKGFLVINCKAGPYRRIVLTVRDNEQWARKISDATKK
ncbi:MAG: hypothetical protein Q7K03_08090 [Dehalococcoidia bacterium]|nr:hypothetical protein [Dehalococcoidia bacterium]